MSILPHHKYLTLRSITICRVPTYPKKVVCASTTTTKRNPNPNQNQLLVESTLSDQQILVPRAGAPMPNDPTLQSTWAHRAWVACGCITVLVSLSKALIGSIDSHLLVQPIVASYIGYVLADLGSGVYHWGIDNYGDASTPIFGAQIEAFQGHHKWPWTITRRQFANNLHALARTVTFFVLPINMVTNDPVLPSFVGACSGCIMFSQQFHAWAHTTKSKLHPLVVALQDAGILVSRSQHAAHHRPPYNNNYCIVSGVWNEFLDTNKVFEALEMALFFKFGVRPRSWTEPSSNWSEDVEEEATASHVATLH